MVSAVREKILARTSACGWIEKINLFLSRRTFVCVLAAFIFIVQALGLDMVGFAVLSIITAFICICGKNTNACVPVFCMFVFCASIQNSPAFQASGFQGVDENGAVIVGDPSTYFSQPIVLAFAVLLAIVIIGSVLFRMIVFGDFSRVFNKKGLFGGICLLSGSFLFSGLGTNGTMANLLFSLFQAFTFGFIYLFFASTIEFKRFNTDYVCNLLLVIMFYNIAMVAYIYLLRFWAFGALNSQWKAYMYSGWGLSLDFGAYIALGISACFYKIHRSKDMRSKLAWMMLIAVALVIMYFTMARGAIICAVVLTVIAVIWGLRYKHLRPVMLAVVACGLIFIGVFAYVLWDTGTWEELFSYYLTALDNLLGGALTGNATAGDVTSGRVLIWWKHVEYFLQNPIFGGGFSINMDIMSSVDPFDAGAFTIYHFLAHNTLFQVLGSCGLVGFAAFTIHILSIAKLFPDKCKAHRLYLLPVLLIYWAMSLLDTIFFKLHFTFIYLAVLLACEADARKNERDSLREKFEKRMKLQSKKSF